jgi:DNA polymerase III epsilon subunit-like protein
MAFKKARQGTFDFILAIDCETTGLNYEVGGDITKGHQALSWGMQVLKDKTFEVMDEFYVEIQWDGESEWTTSAEKIHGMSKKYLEENGVTEEEAVGQIAEFILRYWLPQGSIVLLGQNVHLFDRPFLQKLFEKFGLQLNIRGRHIDTFSVFYTMTNSVNSDEGFTTMGLPQRTLHNALEDIRFTSESMRRMALLWNAKVGVQAEQD